MLIPLVAALIVIDGSLHSANISALQCTPRELAEDWHNKYRLQAPPLSPGLSLLSRPPGTGSPV